MKDKLRQIEGYLQEFIEKNAVRIFGSVDAEAKLVTELIHAMQEQIRVDDEGINTAPNIFSLNVSPSCVTDIRSNQILLNNLAAHLMEAGELAGISFEAHITINVFPDESLKEGQFFVNAMWIEDAGSQTQSMDVDLEMDTLDNIPQKAFLIVGGSKIFTLERDVINIGRKLDNHLVIDDPRVSRTHGQLRAIKGRYMLFDLESSGGTYVNGERINQINLHPGDVISLAGVPVVYGQDAIRDYNDTQEYKHPETVGNQTTTNIKLNQIDQDTFD